MINIIQYPQDTHFLKPIGLIAFGISMHEIITYPLNRIFSRLVVASSIRNVSTTQIYKEIVSKEFYKGLYKGFKTSLEKNIISNISLYFSFQYFFLRYGLLFKEGKTKIPLKEQPYLKFCQYEQFYLISFGSSFISTLLSQPSSIINIKIQNEQLGLPKQKYWDNMKHLEQIMLYHQKSFNIAITPGFKSKLLLQYVQMISEINLFQYLLYLNGYIFMNKRIKYQENQNYYNYFYTFMISLIVPLIFHPLNYLQTRYTIRKLQNMQYLQPLQMIKQDIPSIKTLFNGLGIEIFRYSSRSMLLIYLFWNSAKQ